jgi:hypothetical protein
VIVVNSVWEIWTIVKIVENGVKIPLRNTRHEFGDNLNEIVFGNEEFFS